jgi:hypothetical protein
MHLMLTQIGPCEFFHKVVGAADTVGGRTFGHSATWGVVKRPSL